MTDANTDSTKSHGDGGEHARSEVVRRFLRKSGFRQRLTWIEPEDSDEEKGGPCPREKDQSADEKPVSEATKRKREQRAQDLKKGWAQCNIKAPHDDDARSLMARVGTAIYADEGRKVIWIAVRNPEIVMFGARVRALTGIRQLMVRALLGPERSP
jgi:hypothetical protein